MGLLDALIIATFLLTVAQLALQIFDHRARRRQRAIDISVTVVGGEDGPIVVTARTVDDENAILVELGAVLPHGEELQLPRYYAGLPLPHTLMPNGEFTMLIEPPQLARLLHDRWYAGEVEIRPFFRDHRGARLAGSPYRFDIDQWAEPSWPAPAEAN